MYVSCSPLPFSSVFPSTALPLALHHLSCLLYYPLGPLSASHSRCRLDLDFNLNLDEDLNSHYAGPEEPASVILFLQVCYLLQKMKSVHIDVRKCKLEKETRNLLVQFNSSYHRTKDARGFVRSRVCGCLLDNSEKTSNM